jgi:hypothetical protein
MMACPCKINGQKWACVSFLQIGKIYPAQSPKLLSKNSHRETIEGLASDLFDAAGALQGAVARLFSKHILK